MIRHGARTDRFLATALALAAALPLAWAAAAAVGAGLDLAAWRALAQEPQLPRALLLSILTGVLATALSLAATAFLLSRAFPGAAWDRLVRRLPPLLATPHAAFAIGLAFLLAPSGWILRLFSPWATGLESPPPWPTTQDPWGLGLVAALVAKEIPFLLWTAAGQLQRPDVGARLARELAVARCLGYGARRAWWRIVWPQLLPRLAAPALAVLAYSLTVVDVAIVIGPAAPPTLAVLAWQWLLDADPAVNATGAAAVWLLAFVVALLAAAGWLLLRATLRTDAGGARGRPGAPGAGAAAWGLILLYAAVLLALLVGSFAGVWPFPRLLPDTWTAGAWRAVAASASTVGTTVLLSATGAAAALAWAVAWLETAPAQWDARMRRLLYLPLLLPSVLWVLGLHRLAVQWGWDARWPGVWLAHALAALPYVLIALSPAYLGFDERYRQVAAGLRAGRWRFLLRVKWPLLKAALAGAFAVGFAVGVAQFLPTLFVGAGRFATVTTEAVTLSSGGQRSIGAAYAWLQWLLPALGFALAAWAGRPRLRRPA